MKPKQQLERIQAIRGIAAVLMEDRPSQISVLPVTDAASNRRLGLVRIHDVYQAGIV